MVILSRSVSVFVCALAMGAVACGGDDKKPAGQKQIRTPCYLVYTLSVIWTWMSGDGTALEGLRHTRAFPLG